MISSLEEFLVRSADFRLFSPETPRQAAPFSQDVYERSRGRRFSTPELAYRDWLSNGRAAGLEFSEGKNTLLKVIVKVKDEPEFLPIWLSYYAKFLGLHNIIIVDCGSEEPGFRAYLERLSAEVLVLSYTRHYDDLHHIQTNRDFYGYVASSCKYLSLLDADEFLFAYESGRFGSETIETLLGQGREKAYACTWFPNADAFVPNAMNKVQRFNIDRNILTYGTIAGKSILRSEMCLHVVNLGHNLHVLENLDLFTRTSFGMFGIFHFTKSQTEIARHRSGKHLKSKGVIPNSMSDSAEIETYLRRILMEGRVDGIEAHYARKYIGIATAEEAAGGTFDAVLGTTSDSPAFSQAMDNFDFASLLDRRRKELLQSAKPA